MLPSANAVYGHAATRLSIAELQVLNKAALGERLQGIECLDIAGVDYVGFQAEGLDPRDVVLISTLSSLFVLFERNGETLRPVRPTSRAVFPDDLLTIQKYPGKTNPAFTRLLMNVTLFSTAFAGEMPSRMMAVLDPVCGRGTTLNQALLYGFEAAGIEIDGKDFDAYARFLATWLKENRIKHRIGTAQSRDRNNGVVRRMTAEIGVTKEEFKAGRFLRLEMVNGDTVDAAAQFRPESFDAIVGDLPYGVLHGSRSAGGTSRRPGELCSEALPGWIRLLRPGGAIGLSWNTHVIGREKFRHIVADSGLTLLTDAPYGDFRHDVDQSITRDLVVAVKG